MYNTPVLFIVFNRPSKTSQVIDSLRAIKPNKLYIAADGPRDNNASDHERCRLTKETLNEVDWDCEIKTLFREHNLGCKLAVSSAIDWFFSFEEEGIILEDDILPNVSFYHFCTEMLAKYRYNNEIGMVTGSNLIANKVAIDESYNFSHYANIWGWATWKRAWNSYDVNMHEWPKWNKNEALQKLSDDVPFFNMYWKDILNAIYKNKIDTWDFQWFFNMWYNGLLCIVPKYNLIENIGFDIEATHTDGAKPTYILENPPKLLEFPLTHPNKVSRNVAIDIETSRNIFRIGWKTILKNRLRRNKIFGDFLSKLKRVILSGQ